MGFMSKALFDGMNVAVLMALQRSGTHLITSCVNSHPAARGLPEPFFHRPPQTAVDCESVLVECVDLIRRQDIENGCTTQAMLLDIKYDQCSEIVKEYLLRDPDIPVLHLVRRDKKRQFFSWKLRVWWETPKNRIPLPDYPDFQTYCAQYVPQIPFDQAEFDHYCKGTSSFMEELTPFENVRIYYEDITANHNVEVLPTMYDRILCALLGVPYAPLTSRTVKEAPSDPEPYWR